MAQSRYDNLKSQLNTLAGREPGQVAKTGWENLETDANGVYILPPGVSLNDLATLMNALLSEFNLGNLVPSDLFSKNVRIASLSLTKGSAHAHTSTALRFTLAWDVVWDLELLKISGPQIEIVYTRGYAEGTLAGLLTFGEGTNAVTLATSIDFPSGTVIAELTGGEAKTKSAATIFKQFKVPALPQQQHAPAKGPHLTGLKLLANVHEKVFAMHVGVGNIMLRKTEASGKDLVLEIADLQGDLLYSGGAQGQATGQLWATLHIGQKDKAIKLSILAARQQDGWLFGGSISGATGSITLKTFVNDLLLLFGISASAPAELDNLILVGLSVSFDTATKDFTFFCDVKFPKSGSAELQLSVAFSHTQNDKYIHTFSGSLMVAKREFDLVFSQEGAAGQSTESYFIGAYRDLAGQKLKLADLIKAIDKDAAKFASSLDVELKDALIAYVSKGNGANATTQLLAAVDLGLGVNLSKLPLVGSLFPSPDSLQLAFQPLLTSAEFQATLLQKISGLIPNGGIPLPNKNIGKGLELITRIKIGDTTTELDVALSAAKKQLQQPFGMSNGQLTANKPPAVASNIEIEADAAIPAPAATSSGAKKAGEVTPIPGSGDVTWFDVQQTLGPINFRRVGVQYQGGNLWLLLDASLSALGLDFVLNGLGAGISFADLKKHKFDPKFSLRGLGMDFKEGPLEIGGDFLRDQVTVGTGAAKETIDAYDGMLTVQVENFSLSAIGSYAQLKGHASVFVYLVLDYPLGGPAFFFVNGVAGGFGYNRDLIAPKIDQVLDFPLVAQAIKPPAAPLETKSQDRFQKLNDEIGKLQQYIPPKIGQYFLAAGLRYTSFELFDSFTLLTVAFGQRLEVNLLGISTAAIPTPEAGQSIPLLAEVQIAIKATYIPSQGLLSFRAQLTRNSYIFSRQCSLTGGLAFYAWFKDQANGAKAGEFVFTIGGYHAKFQPPTYYPRVPQLGFNWHVGDTISIKGNAYFALCPHALMAGGHLEALWKSGALSAWFKAGADFLLGWKPFHYDAEIYVSIGASLTFHFFGTHHVTVELGGDLHLWGPKFSGKVKIHYYIISVTVDFGDSKPQATPIPWTQFRDSFLPQDPATKTAPVVQGGAAHSAPAKAPAVAHPAKWLPNNVCSVTVKRGLVKTIKVKNAKTHQDGEAWIINPKQFHLVADSVLPITATTINGKSYGTPVGIAPMGVKTGQITTTYKITISGAGSNANFAFQPLKKAVPAALWGDNLQPDINGKRTIPDLLTGFEITPAEPVHAPKTHPIDKKNLAFDTQDRNSAYEFVAPKTFATAAKQTKQAVNKSINRKTTVDRRNKMLKSLGFHTPMLETELGPNPADLLLAAPQIGQYS